MAVLATKNKVIIYAAAAAVILFIFGLIQQNSEHGSEQLSSAISSARGKAGKVWAFAGGEKSFYEIALSHGTDKVTTHSYHDMYQKYLPAVRNKRIKMLEIGLGCDMNYGPGASYYTWLEYFPNVDLYYMEYDAKCAAQWAHKTTGATITTGDQGDPNVLEEFIKKYGTDFDIIIDDGGHTMEQQKTSLKHLWKAVKPGGMYFCEDLQTSFMSTYGGGRPGAPGTMIQYISAMMSDLSMMTEEPLVNFPRQVVFQDVEKMVHVDCCKEVCMFEKRLE